MSTYTTKRHLLAWVRKQLITELDEAQLFNEQREQIVAYVNLVREIEETVTREHMAELKALKDEARPMKSTKKLRDAKSIEARRQYWKSKREAA